MDINNYIQQKIEQVQTILDTLKSKVKIVISLSSLLKNDKLTDILKPNEMKIVRQLRYQFKIIRETDITNDVDEKLSFLMEVLNLNPEVHKLINNYLQNEETLLKYVNAIDQYKHYIEEEMKTNMKMSIDWKNQLHNSTMNFKNNEIELDFFERQLKDHNDRYKNYIQKLQIEIQLCKSNFEHQEIAHENQIAKITDSSEQEMMYVSKCIKYQAEDLNNQIKNENKKYKQLIKSNVVKETELQKIRFNAEDKLLQAIALYDTEIGQLHEFKENLKRDLSFLKHSYEDVKQKFLQQEPQYLELKKEKELIILQIFTERLDNFEKNRAARKIQNYWRAHRERMSRKKRKSKRK